MTILVVVPTFRTPQEMLNKCVASLLEQTFQDLCLLVLGDGETPKVNSSDSRLIVHALAENRGRYFADSVAQRATPFRWYSPHDADDWSDPDRLEDLWQYRETGDGVVWSDHYNHMPSGAKTLATFPRATKPLGPKQQRQGCHLGLYEIDRLAATGMYRPDFRVHYDSLHNSLVKMTGKVAVSPRPLYHRVRWNGSLTMAPATRLSGPYRRAAAVRCHAIYASAYKLYTSGRSDRIAAMIQSTIDPRTMEAVQTEVERLRKELG